MPLPIGYIFGQGLASIARGAGSFAGRAATAIGTGGAIATGMALFDPATRTARYAANRRIPNALPDPETLLGNYYANRTSYVDLVELMKAQGFDIAGAKYPGSAGSIAWENAIDLARPLWSMDDHHKWWRQGRIPFARMVDLLSRKGFTDPEQVKLYLYDYENLPVDVIRGLYLLGILDAQSAASRLEKHGWYGLDAGRIIESWDTVPAPFETLTLLNRGNISTQTAERYLEAQGYKSNVTRSHFMQLKNQIPSASDLIHFALRESWDQAIVDAYGYDSEFPKPFKHWMKKQGFDWAEDIVTDDGTTIKGVNWPNLYWRSHWRAISPEQAYVALHRFRGKPDDPATWRVPGVKPFTTEDVSRVLKIADSALALVAVAAGETGIPTTDTLPN